MRKNSRQRPKRPRLSDFARRLLAEWQRLGLPNSAENTLLAVSGGADSTALLLALDELVKAERLSLNLIVAHLDHRLRKASKEDAEWVRQLSKTLNRQAVIASANIKKRAKDTADNLEQAARRARYEFFRTSAAAEDAKLVLTAHTLDDQAETILMRLIRGSAAEGLSGTECIRPLDNDSSVRVVRPLLSWARRSDTEHYCRARRIRFRVDEMNADERFVRVKIRQQLLPLMQSFNNRIVEALTRTATLLREDAAALSEQANLLLQQATEAGSAPRNKTQIPPVNVSILANAPAAIRRRALRQWISQALGHVRRIEMVHLLAVEKLLEGNRGRVAELPKGAKVTRKGGWLY
ncbi:MAG: tRNA lysidine(34) synthetase TilS, partial [Pyrinomonadaceae bacterium]